MVRLPVVLILAVALLPAPAIAQPDTPRDQAPDHEAVGLVSLARDLWGDLTHLPSRSTVIWVGGAGALGAAFHPLDDDVAVGPGKEWAKWSEVFDPGTYIGNPLILHGSTLAVYGIGRWRGQPRVAHVARDMLRAQILAQVLVHATKFAVNRERPDQSNDQSFPSGHAATAFASAVVFQKHLGRKWAIPTYLIAAYVATSRLHENRHYLSDVIVGAGVGVATGMTSMRHATRPWTASPAVVPGGVALMVTRTEGR